ncbi:MAG: cystathionine gamma-synthase [Actinomycetia bacterium]|nr:cystathionine gamma-synthase [Actinomycetes bacterium]MCP4960785.1 cystathionine gamma-synthase [Actinomycetes bacterium]
MAVDRPSDGFETRALHAGQDPERVTGAVIPPIFQTSTFAQPAVGEHLGYEYARTGNPTRTALETCLAALEGADHGIAFASGMAACDTLLRRLRPGDHIGLGDDAYGGTYRLISAIFSVHDVGHSAVDLTDAKALDTNWNPATQIVWLETPTNPLLTIVDIAAVAEVVHKHGAKLVVDNTFASPYLQQPLALGADAVVHSTTKYIGGHSDVVGGFVATNDAEWAADLRYLQNAIGAVPGPQDCFLTLRGVKTLGVRMDRHCSNARAVVDMLVDHPAVSKVLYPGLPNHPGHDIAASQMADFGGMVSFRVKGGVGVAMKIAAECRLFTLAESLGGVESLIEHPGVMTHASAAGSALEVPDDLIRVSVGIETAADLVDDLRQALDRLG